MISPSELEAELTKVTDPGDGRDYLVEAINIVEKTTMIQPEREHLLILYMLVKDAIERARAQNAIDNDKLMEALSNG